MIGVIYSPLYWGEKSNITESRPARLLSVYCMTCIWNKNKLIVIIALYLYKYAAYEYERLIISLFLFHLLNIYWTAAIYLSGSFKPHGAVTYGWQCWIKSGQIFHFKHQVLFKIHRERMQKQEATVTEETISLHRVDSRKQSVIEYASESGRWLNYRKPKFPNSVSYSEIEMRCVTIIFPLTHQSRNYFPL